MDAHMTHVMPRDAKWSISSWEEFYKYFSLIPKNIYNENEW